MGHIHYMEFTGEIDFRADGTYLLYACTSCMFSEWRKVETDWGENNG